MCSTSLKFLPSTSNQESPSDSFFKTAGLSGWGWTHPKRKRCSFVVFVCEMEKFGKEVPRLVPLLCYQSQSHHPSLIFIFEIYDACSYSYPVSSRIRRTSNPEFAVHHGHKTSPLLYRALKVFNKPMTTAITAVMYHRRRRTRIVARTPVTLVKFLSPGLSYLTSKTSGFVMRNHSCFPEMDLSPCSKRRQKSITILVI